MILCRLVQFLLDDSSSLELKLESVVLLGSLAKGTEENIRALVDASCVSLLLRGSYPCHGNYNLLPSFINISSDSADSQALVSFCLERLECNNF